MCGVSNWDYNYSLGKHVMHCNWHWRQRSTCGSVLERKRLHCMPCWLLLRWRLCSTANMHRVRCGDLHDFVVHRNSGRRVYCMQCWDELRLKLQCHKLHCVLHLLGWKLRQLSLHCLRQHPMHSMRSGYLLLHHHERGKLHNMQCVYLWPVCFVCLYYDFKQCLYCMSCRQLLSFSNHLNSHRLRGRHKLLSCWRHCAHHVQYVCRWYLCFVCLHHHRTSHLLCVHWRVLLPWRGFRSADLFSLCSWNVSNRRLHCFHRHSVRGVYWWFVLCGRGHGAPDLLRMRCGDVPILCLHRFH